MRVGAVLCAFVLAAIAPGNEGLNFAGLVDIKDVKQPRLLSLFPLPQPPDGEPFIPPAPLKRYGPQPPNDLVQQSEDVLVDTRGYVYLDDKHWGLFIRRYTGPDQPPPTAK